MVMHWLYPKVDWWMKRTEVGEEWVAFSPCLGNTFSHTIAVRASSKQHLDTGPLCWEFFRSVSSLLASPGQMSHRRESLAVCGEMQTQLCQIVWQFPLRVKHSAAPATAKGRGHKQSTLMQPGSPQHQQLNPTTTVLSMHWGWHWDGHFTTSIVTMPSCLPTSLASLLFTVTALSMTLIKQQFWPLPLAQKSLLFSLFPQASQNQAFQKCGTLASLHETDPRHKLMTANFCGQEHPIPILSTTISKPLLHHTERAVTAVLWVYLGVVHN